MMIEMPVEDRIAVEELTYRYAFHSDTKDWNAVIDLFTDDCILDEEVIGLPIMKGKEAITGYYIGGAVDMMDYFIHYVTNHRMTEYSGDRARCLSHVYCVGKIKDGPSITVLGYMNDECAKIDGVWLIKHRRLEVFTPPIGLEL